MKNIVIIGSGGHAKVIADIILKRKEMLNERINIIGFLDDNFQSLNYKEIFNIPILGDTKLINEFNNKDYEYIIAIGNNLIRKKIAEKYLLLNYYTAIHPMAIIGNEVEIGMGTVIMANVVINSYSKVGKHCILNTSCVIEHDNKIENYVHVSPKTVLCGGVSIGESSWIGAGSSVRQEIMIGKSTIIGVGAVVIRDVKNNCIVVGNPAKQIKGF